MSAPVVPQRPARSQNSASSAGDAPQIPPRPTQNLDLSTSPNREARSPLNVAPFASKVPPTNGRSKELDPSDGYRLERLPSITQMPTVGQEGMEYSSLEPGSAEGQDPTVVRSASPNETRNVAGDLPLHAPKASQTKLSAQSQIEPITRTDSTQAAEVGIGKPQTEYEEHERSPRPPSARSGHQRPPSATSQDRHHDAEHEHGIPEIGVHVPLLAMAGDVQAPSATTPQATKDTRRRSAQGYHGPPGSYGLHGHGKVHNDQFEKAWYQKHPEELAKEEHGAYGPSLATQRGEWAMSQAELNRLVRESGRSGLTKEGSAPTEELGYMVSEEYNSRMNSPNVQPVNSDEASQANPISPLRKAYSPRQMNDSSAIDGELENDTINLESGSRRGSRLGRGDHNVEFLSRQSTNVEDFGAGRSHTPILASDETAKDPRGEYLQPAVGSEYQTYDDQNQWYDQERHSRESSRPSSRPTSRPSSMYGTSGGLSRYTTADDGAHHQLEEIEEYEPLFVDGDGKKVRPVNAEKLRKQLSRFPSKDVWEDSPSSVYLETTVVPPEQLEENENISTVSKTGGKQEDEVGELVKIPAKVKYDHHGRPVLKQRFPSRDIWEDSPDSARVETVIYPSDEPEAKSPPDEAATPAAVSQKPQVPPRPPRAKTAEQTQLKPQDPSPPKRFRELSTDEQSSSQSTETSPTEERKQQSISDRAKPSVPPRPARSSQTVNTGGATLEKTTSAGSDDAGSSEREVTSPTGKTKPPVPARPGDKMASFKADLASRLQLGPKPPQKAEPQRDIPAEEEEDKTPLNDARKSRAKGPSRRKPATQSTPEPAPAPQQQQQIPKLTVSLPETTWSIDDSVSTGAVQLRNRESAAKAPTSDEPTQEPSAVPIATNTAGETLSPSANLTHRADSSEDAATGSGGVGPESVPEPTREEEDPLARAGAEAGDKEEVEAASQTADTKSAAAGEEDAQAADSSAP